LHLLHDLAELAHSCDQPGGGSILLPVAGYDKDVVVVLNAFVSVILGFEQIKSDSDIPAFDIATFVEIKPREHEHMDKFH
jgi:hypothetical protein